MKKMMIAGAIFAAAILPGCSTWNRTENEVETQIDKHTVNPYEFQDLNAQIKYNGKIHTIGELQKILDAKIETENPGMDVDVIVTSKKADK